MTPELTPAGTSGNGPGNQAGLLELSPSWEAEKHDGESDHPIGAGLRVTDAKVTTGLLVHA